MKMNTTSNTGFLPASVRSAALRLLAAQGNVALVIEEGGVASFAEPGNPEGSYGSFTLADYGKAYLRSCGAKAPHAVKKAARRLAALS